MRILLVEDDPMIGGALQEHLQDAAYAVDWVRDGSLALRCTYANDYDAVLLDLGLPGMDGLEFLRAFRQDGAAAPVIVITARGGLEDRISGLDLGADDFLVKPFDLGELLARLRAVLRRGTEHGSGVLSNGTVELDPRTHAASVEGGDAVTLTKREFAVLRALLMRPGAVLSREDLEQRVYGWGEEVDSNAVEFTIHRLRAKLGSDTIKNVRGIGWLVPKQR